MATNAPNSGTPDDVAGPSTADGKLYEVKRGQLVEKPTSVRGNHIATRIASHLMGIYPESKAYIIAQQPTYCFDDPTEMRIPDAVLIFAHRIAGGLDDNELHLAPDLVVEVILEKETYDDVHDLIAQYLKAGVSLIWVVNPVGRNVHVFRHDGSVAKFRQKDTIKDEPLLPGLVLSVASIFPNAPGGTTST